MLSIGQVGLGLGAGYGTYAVVLPAIDASTAKIVKVHFWFGDEIIWIVKQK